MRRLSGSIVRLEVGRWHRCLLLVVLCTLLGVTGSLAPVAVAAAQSSSFCIVNAQCPPGELCCPVPGPSSFKRCTLPFNGGCPPVV